MSSQALNLVKKLASFYPWTQAPLIVGAPMRVLSGPKLAVAVSSAGGLGFIGPRSKTGDTLTALEEAKQLLQASNLQKDFNSNSENSNNVLPVGVGFQTWNDDLKIAVSAIETKTPCAAWLFAPRNGQEEFDEWTRHIRQVSPKTNIWIQVGTLREALLAVESREPPDVLVVQGAEAGGHGRAYDGIGLMTLLPEISDAVKGSGIPVVAAGGITDGRGAAAAMCLGGAGVAIGTRFLASTEANISKGYQNEIVRASDGGVSTRRTTLYNQLRGTVGWPEEFSPRTVLNRSWVDFSEGKSFEELKVLHDEAAETGDGGWGPEGRLATYAGAGVGLIHGVSDARHIVEQVRKEMLAVGKMYTLEVM